MAEGAFVDQGNPQGLLILRKSERRMWLVGVGRLPITTTETHFAKGIGWRLSGSGDGGQRV